MKKSKMKLKIGKLEEVLARAMARSGRLEYENGRLRVAVGLWREEEESWVSERLGMLGEIAYLNVVADELEEEIVKREDVAIRIGGERNHLEGEVKLLDEDNKRLREERDGYMKALDAIRKARDGFLNA